MFAVGADVARPVALTSSDAPHTSSREQLRFGLEQLNASRERVRVLQKRSTVRIDRHLDFVLPAMSNTPPAGRPTEEPPRPSYPDSVRGVLNASAGDSIRGSVRCPPSSWSISVQMSGGTGDAHVFMSLERTPTPDDFDIDLPGRGGLFSESDSFLPGIWNILVQAETDLFGVEVVVECT